MKPHNRVILKQGACPTWHKGARTLSMLNPNIVEGAGSNQMIILEHQAQKNSKIVHREAHGAREKYSNKQRVRLNESSYCVLGRESKT